MGPPPKPSGGSRGFGGERRSSEMSELSPPGGSEGYGACDDEGAAPCGRPQAFPPQGGRWPAGPDEGAMRGASPPWAPSSVSLRSTASPWKGEAFLRGARRLGAPTSAPAEVIRRHEITHHVGRGLAPSTQSLPPSFASQMPPPSSEGGFFAGFTPYIPRKLSLLWDVFIHLLEIGRYCAYFPGKKRRGCFFFPFFSGFLAKA